MPAVSPGGRGGGTWEARGRQERGESRAGEEDAEEGAGCRQPRLQLGASPPQAPQRHGGAVVQSRWELVRPRPGSAEERTAQGPDGARQALTAVSGDPLKRPKGDRLGLVSGAAAELGTEVQMGPGRETGLDCLRQAKGKRKARARARWDGDSQPRTRTKAGTPGAPCFRELSGPWQPGQPTALGAPSPWSERGPSGHAFRDQVLVSISFGMISASFCVCTPLCGQRGIDYRQS